MNYFCWQCDYPCMLVANPLVPPTRCPIDGAKVAWKKEVKE